MILTVSQYLEALASPNGRWRTLRRVRPVADPSGGPLFVLPGNRVVDLEVTADGTRQTLRCPLRWDDDSPGRLSSFVRMQRGLEGRFFTEWRVLRSEVVVFDDEGRPYEVDILARPAATGEPLVDFLEKAAAAGDTDAMDAAGRSFDDLVSWARRVDRGGIALRRLVASPSGEVALTAFSATDYADSVRHYMHSLRHRPRQIPKNDVDEPPRPVPEHYRDYEEYTWDDYWEIATAMNEGCWSLVDADGRQLTTEPYDWLGECSEGLILAQKGSKCGFIDLAGRQAVPFVYDDANSFFEGCALVSREGESYLIDPRGERI